ncbi:MAG: c-type cytochrome [Kofleriaceae bacterium]|nr:c-type cytochrome [Kofleriaceae bacterium]
MRILPWIVLGFVAACSSASEDVASDKIAPSAIAVKPAPAMSEEAIALIKRFECNRCHEGENFGVAPPDKQCVGCHRQILDGNYEAKPELVAKWRSNIHSLPVAPSLISIGKKLRQSWVRSQLLHPVDQRPGLEATMPRLAMSDAEAGIFGQALVPQEAPEEVFSKQAAAQGATLFEKFSCGSCHSFGASKAGGGEFSAGSRATAKPSRDELALAPDLFLTRDRFQSGRLVEWLMNPQSIDPHTLMPNFGFSRAQATSLAAYLWHHHAQPRPVSEIPGRLPALEREVRWDEVFTKVFKTVCWHCHSSKELALGDGGPGNTGGLGFPAKGLDFSSYQAIRSGSLGKDGKRRSIFVKDASGTSLLVRHLLARQLEERGQESPDVRGMPLGFPSLSAEQVQLVESWIAQGRPQ